MKNDVSVWLSNLRDEREGAALYEGLAASEKDPSRAQRFHELAAAERRHASIWARRLAKADVPLPPERRSPRIAALVWLSRMLGTRAVLPFVLEAEKIDARKYVRQGGDAARLAEDERAHHAVLEDMQREQPPAAARDTIASRENWHVFGRRGAIRAAVFGMNDGIVSNLALVVGVAGAGVGPREVVVTGIAGLLAGACSMAAGEYSSVSTQRDLLRRQIHLERLEIEQAPAEEARELAHLLKEKGVSHDQARRTADQIMRDPRKALDMLVREELGLDPDDLGSPGRAAVSSFVTFAVGAFVPLAPFLFAEGRGAIALGAALCGAVLALVGMAIGYLSGTGPWRPAGRMVGLAALAAGVTFAVGKAFGASIA